jgi:hypothetical protein
MLQYPLALDFFTELGGFADSCPRTSPHGPGYCYTGPTIQLLDNNLGFEQPANGLLQISLSAQPGENDSYVSGNVIVQLYAVNVFSSVNATQLELTPGFREIAHRTMPVNSGGIQHGFAPGGPTPSLQPSELAALALAANSNTGGVSLGLRFWNDPSCPNAATLKIIQWAGRLSLGRTH